MRSLTAWILSSRIARVDHRYGKREPIQLIEDSGTGGSWEPNYRERAQMDVAEARFEASDQGLVRKQRVEMHGRLRDTHALRLGRDRGVEIGQGVGIIEPVHFWYEALEELEHAICAVDKAT